MTLYCFMPPIVLRAEAIGCALRRVAYPLDCRIPEPLVHLLELIDGR